MYSVTIGSDVTYGLTQHIGEILELSPVELEGIDSATLDLSKEKRSVPQNKKSCKFGRDLCVSLCVYRSSNIGQLLR
jgi:hypothetical protein